MGLRDRLHNLEQAAPKDLLIVPLLDSTVASFHEDAFMECFLHELDRGREHHFGEPVPPAHPLVEALREAEDLEELAKKHGGTQRGQVGVARLLRAATRARLSVPCDQQGETPRLCQSCQSATRAIPPCTTGTPTHARKQSHAKSPG